VLDGRVDAWTPAGHAALGRPALDEVRRLERLSARAWPALEVAPLGGWVLRSSGGATRRLNSAWPRAARTLTADQLLRATIAWYERRDLPPRLQLSPANEPADLADHLDSWSVDGETLVLTGPVEGRPVDGVEVAPVVSDGWIRLAAEVFPSHFGPDAVGSAVLQRISKTCAYAVAHASGDPVGVARAVVDGDDAGVFSVGVLPSHRGAGHARRLMSALGHWAAEQQANRLWLQVEAGNAAALGLYAGLSPVFSYAYATRTG